MIKRYTDLTLNEWQRKTDLAKQYLQDCHVCPWGCHVNRYHQLGICKISQNAKVASHAIHDGEEPPISGYRGSGAIFFSGCNLRCVFCQNWPISQKQVGNDVSPDALATMMLALQKKGAHNINLVTASHVVPQVVLAVSIAAAQGLTIPIVYNSSGYDGQMALDLLENIVDIYMPDLKYGNAALAKQYSKAVDYWEHATKAIKQMWLQVGNLHIGDDGLATRGMIVRHLVLPKSQSGTKQVLEFLSTISQDIHISLMSQFFPANQAHQYEALQTILSGDEWQQAKLWLQEFGLEHGFIQDEIDPYQGGC